MTDPAREVIARAADWFGWRASRILCRALRRHTRHCRGRSDHVRDGKIIDPGRWSR